MQRINGVYQSKAGRVVVGAIVQVVLTGTNTPATLYADKDGAITIAELKTDNEGEYGFYVANGRYDVFMLVNGRRDGQQLDVQAYDPDDDTQIGQDPEIPGIKARVDDLEANFEELSATVEELGTDLGSDLDNANGTRNVWGIWAKDQIAQVSDLAEPEGADMIGAADGGSIQDVLDDLISAAGGAADKQDIDEKDASGGYAGLSGFNIRLKNSTGLVTSELASAAVAGRTWTFPNKDGTVAMLSDIPAPVTPGSMVLLGSATVSSAVALINFLTLFSSSYNKYVIEMEGITISASATLQFRVANAGAASAAASYTNFLTPGSTSATDSNTLFSAGAASTSARTATFVVRNANDAVNPKGIGFSSMYNTGSTYESLVREGLYIGAHVLTGFQLSLSTGNFTGGTVRVYGIKNS